MSQKIIKLLNNGLIIDDKTIYYKDIEHFYIKDEFVRSHIYLDIKIKLKNGEVITARIIDNEEEQAKVYYAEIFFNNGGKFSKEHYKCFDNSFWIVSLIVAVILFFGFRGDLFGLIGVVVSVFVFTLYAIYLVGIIHYGTICKKIKKLIKQRKDDKL